MSKDALSKNRLQNYRVFATRVTEKFDDILERNQQRMQCQSGCHSCCLPGLNVFSVERANIREYLHSNPEVITKIRESLDANLYHGTRCEFLDASGDCRIYDVRPIICRSHGAPIFVPESSTSTESEYDVCPLNFVDQDIRDLPALSFINIEILNTVLAQINNEFSGDDKGARHALTLSGILEN